MAEHTPGPLLPRRINHAARPFAVINPNGPHGDEIVGGYMTEGDAYLYAAAPDLLAACKSALSICGYGNRHNEEAIGKALEAAIAKAEPLSPEQSHEER